MKNDFIQDYRGKVKKFAEGHPRYKKAFRETDNASYIGEYVERVDLSKLNADDIVALAEIIFASRFETKYEIYDVQVVAFAKRLKDLKVKDTYTLMLVEAALLKSGQKAMLLTRKNMKISVAKEYTDAFIKKITDVNVVGFVSATFLKWFEQEYKNHLDKMFEMYSALRLVREESGQVGQTFLDLVFEMRMRLVTVRSKKVKPLIEYLGINEVQFKEIHYRIATAGQTELRSGEIETVVEAYIGSLAEKYEGDRDTLKEEVFKMYKDLSTGKWWYSDRITFEKKGLQKTKRMLAGLMNCVEIIENIQNAEEILRYKTVSAVLDAAEKSQNEETQTTLCYELNCRIQELDDNELIRLHQIDPKWTVIDFDRKVAGEYLHIREQKYSLYLKTLRLGIGEHSLKEWSNIIVQKAINKKRSDQTNYTEYFNQELYELTDLKVEFKALQLREEYLKSKYTDVKLKNDYTEDEIGLWMTYMLIGCGTKFVIELIENTAIAEQLNIDCQWLFDFFFKGLEKLPHTNVEKNAKLMKMYGSSENKEKALREEKKVQMKADFKTILEAHNSGSETVEAYQKWVEMKCDEVFKGLLPDFKKEIHAAKKTAEYGSSYHYYGRRNRYSSYGYESQSDKLKKASKQQHYQNLLTIMEME